MRKLLFIIGFISFLAASAQTHEVVKFDRVQEILDSKNDTLYVLNFWATWCQPCVKELPYFEEANEKYKDQPVKVILISLDFKSDIEKRVVPFLEKRQLKSEVWILDETKQNEFIPKVEDGWSGAIPFTLIIRGSDGHRFWKEGKMTSKELDDQISSQL